MNAIRDRIHARLDRIDAIGRGMHSTTDRMHAICDGMNAICRRIHVSMAHVELTGDRMHAQLDRMNTIGRGMNALRSGMYSTTDRIHAICDGMNAIRERIRVSMAYIRRVWSPDAWSLTSLFVPRRPATRATDRAARVAARHRCRRSPATMQAA